MRLSTFVLVASLVSVNAPAADRFARGPVSAPAVGDDQDTYGTSTLTVYSIPAPNFTPQSDTVVFGPAGRLDRNSTGGMEASPVLPNGSQIERIELRACDSTAAGQVTLQVGPCPTGGSACTLAAFATTGAAATPGCTNFAVDVVPPLIVNNQTTPILAVVATDASTSFSAVKFYYRLRVSPAPAVASFADVPLGHPQLRFVEALAAAGITGGCGGGNFCPDAPLTRGQMAVFLSTALGLHFPN